MKYLFVIACLFGSFTLRSAFAQAPFPTTVTDQNQQVNLPFPSSFGGDIDQVSIENGSLTINIPFVNIPGRGLKYNFGLRYGSAFWGVPNVTNPVWTAMGANYLAGPVLGWETNQPYATWSFQTSKCGTTGTEDDTTSFIVTDSAGGKHTFPVLGQKVGIGCTQTGLGFSYENTSVPDSFPDGMIAGTNSEGTALTTVTLKDGTVLTAGGTAPPAAPGAIISTGLATITDLNGNTQSLFPGGTDTIGRTLVTASNGSEQILYTVKDSNGQSENYTVNLETTPISTDFQAGPKETTGSVQEIRSITLPNGLSYSFSYDSYGDVTSLTLPSGAQIVYGWGTVQNGPASHRYVTSRTTVVDGVTSEWQLLVTCSTCSAAHTSTITDPSHNQQVYSFTNQFATSVKFYNGAATGTPIRQYAIQPFDGANLQYSLPGIVDTTLENGLVKRTTYSYYEFTYPVHFSAPGVSPTTSQATTSNGDLTALQEYDWGNGSPGPLLRQTFITYLYQVAPSGAPSRVTEEDIFDGSVSCASASTCSAKLLSQTLNTYDGSNSASTHKGNLTSTAHLISGSTYATTSYSYDSYGNVLSETDPKNYLKKWGYSNQWDSSTNTCAPSGASAYPTSFTDPLSHASSYTYYACTGLLQTERDPNDIASNRSGTIHTYDEANAPLLTTYPDGGSVSNNYNGYALPLKITTTQAALPDPAIVTAIVYDALGRKKQTQIVSDPVAVTYTDTTYDSYGRIASISNPYHSTSDVTYGITSYLYDALGRKISQCQPDNSSTPSTTCVPKSSYLTWNYTGNFTTFFNENGSGWQWFYDGLGRLIKVLEPNGTSPAATLETDYSYDALNNLLRVDQWGGAKGAGGDRVRTFTYDSLSRLLSAANPETGTVSYTYDSNGNVKTKADARGISTTFSYDALNRLISKQASGINYAYAYDTGTNGIGRLTYASNNVNANTQYASYDPMGRLTKQTYWTPSSPNNTSIVVTATYDLAGDLSSITYPDGRVVKQTWDGADHLQTVTYDNWNGTNIGYNYLSSASYWANGAPQAIIHGDGVADGQRLNNRLQPIGIGPVHIGADGPGTYTGNFGLASRVYCYGPAATAAQTASVPCPSLGSANSGNTLQILDSLNGNNSQAFSYDTLNRIASFTNGNGAMQQTYSIDAWGNMSQVAPGTVQSNIFFGTNNQITSGGYGYDASGNLTAFNNGISTVAYTYDAEGEMLTANSGSATYTYDAEGNRVRKDAGGAWTEYVQFNGQPIAEKNSDGTWSDYIYANGQRMVRADSFDIRIHMSGTNCSNCGTSPNMFAGTTSLTAANGYVIRAGDLLTWRQYQDGSALGGLFFGLLNSSGTYVDGTSLQDTDHQPILADATKNSWHVRTVDLSSFAGMKIDFIDPFDSTNAPAGAWDIYYGDITLVSTDGTFIPIYSRSMMSLSLATAPGVSGFSAITEKVADTVPLTTTTYYHGDQIGSARLLTAGTGWPVSSNTFYPYGQGPTSGTNHYLFTGKERDSESGNDYFGARYYASTMGRWMSPDYDDTDDDPEPVPYADFTNPQTLNLYSFAQNNPLSRRDYDGHASWQDCADGSGSQCWTGDYNGEYNNGLFWNSKGGPNGTGQWQQDDPNPPPPDDPAGIFFTGLTRAMLGQNYGFRQMADGFSKDFFTLGGKSLAALITTPATALGARKTYLYEKVGPNGEHLKYGITNDPKGRYGASELNGGKLKILAEGSRGDMLNLERNLHETLPIGPEEGQSIYIDIQVNKGLAPPPYDPIP